MQRIVELNECLNLRPFESNVAVVCDGTEKFITTDLNSNRELVLEFAQLFRHLLYRVFGEETTDFTAISSQWIRGDKGGWLKIATNRRLSTLSKVVGTATSTIAVSASEELLKFFVPGSIVFNQFMHEYRNRDYEFDMKLLNENLKAVIIQAPLAGCVTNSAIEHAAQYYRQRAVKKANVNKSTSNDPNQSSSPVPNQYALLLEPLEYFIFCLCRYPCQASLVTISNAIALLQHASNSTLMVNSITSGNNYLSLLDRYIIHYLNEWEVMITNRVSVLSSSNVNSNSSGMKSPSGRSIRSAITGVGAGINMNGNSATTTPVAGRRPGGSGGVRTPLANHGQASYRQNQGNAMNQQNNARMNGDLFLSMFCTMVMLKPLVVRTGFDLVVQQFPHVQRLLTFDSNGRVLHPSPLDVIVLNITDVDITMHMQASIAAASAVVQSQGYSSNSYANAVVPQVTPVIPAWCPTVESLQSIYVLIKRALAMGTNVLALHEQFTTSCSSASSDECSVNQHVERLCSLQRCSGGVDVKFVSVISSLWTDPLTDRLLNEMTWCGNDVLQKLQQPLFDMLRAIFSYGNCVPSCVLFYAIEIWLMYVQPWRHSNNTGSTNSKVGTYSTQWNGYVQANYHYYTTLACILIQTLSGANSHGKSLIYSTKDSDSLRCVNYMNTIAVELFGIHQPGSLMSYLNTCGTVLSDVLLLTVNRQHVTPEHISSVLSRSTLNQSELFVLACHHRNVYPDASVLTDHRDAGIIVNIPVTIHGFLVKMLEILAVLRSSYESVATTAAVTTEQSVESWLRSWMGLDPLESSNTNGKRDQSSSSSQPAHTVLRKGVNKNCDKLDMIANHLCLSLCYYDEEEDDEEKEKGDAGVSTPVDPSNYNNNAVTNISPISTTATATETYRKYEDLCIAAQTAIAPVSSTISVSKSYQRARIQAKHLPVSCSDVDADRTTEGKLTAVGRKQLMLGERVCRQLLLTQPKDSLILPVELTEVPYLVGVYTRLSQYLNEVYQLPRDSTYTAVTWDDAYYYLLYHNHPPHGSTNTNTNDSKVGLIRSKRWLWLNKWIQIPHASSNGFRFNLRWLANIRITLILAALLGKLFIWLLLFAVQYYFQLRWNIASSIVSTVLVVLLLSPFSQLFYDGKFACVYLR